MPTSIAAAPPVAQVRFPDQAAAPPGPVDLLPMYLMHHAFRRDLSRFAAAAAGTAVGNRRRWTALSRRWRRFSRVLHLHHAGEDDILWPLLLTRVDSAGDQAGRATLEAMETEHKEIDPLLTACTAGFTAMASGADTDTRAALVVRVAAAAARLGQHLGHEETDAMVLVQRHITPAEWEAMHPEFGRHYTAADALFALPWVLYRVPADLRPPVVAFLGRGPTLAWALLLRLPFAARERWIFAEAGARGGVDA